MSENYINKNFSDIKSYADVIEKRIDDDTSRDELIRENNKNLNECKKYGLKYILINEKYCVDIDIEELV